MDLETEREMWDSIAKGDAMLPAAAAKGCNAKDLDMSGWAPIKPCPEGAVKCDGCRGDGVFYGAGGTVNGKFVGFTGTCFRCGGKGHQTKSDVARNRTYDRNRRFTL